MTTRIEQLKREIQREKNIHAGIKEMRALQEEKEGLESELKRLRRENKYGEKKNTLIKVGSELKKLGGQFMGYAREAQKIQAKKDKVSLTGGIFR